MLFEYLINVDVLLLQWMPDSIDQLNHFDALVHIFVQDMLSIYANIVSSEFAKDFWLCDWIVLRGYTLKDGGWLIQGYVIIDSL